jgi:hypothetical protein
MTGREGKFSSIVFKLFPGVYMRPIVFACGIGVSNTYYVVFLFVLRHKIQNAQTNNRTTQLKRWPTRTQQQRVLHVEQELLTLPNHLISPPFRGVKEVWTYQRGNQNGYIEGQIIQLSKQIWQTNTEYWIYAEIVTDSTTQDSERTDK